MAGPLLRRLSGSLLPAALTLLLGGDVSRMHAQTGGLPLIVRGSYTTSAKLFLTPTSPSPSLREEFRTVTNIFGAAVEIRTPVSEDGIFVSLSAEYISTVETGDRELAFGGVLRSLPVRDGFFLVPIEVGVLATIPLGSETFGLTMGGGAGAYIGGRVLDVADVGVNAVGSRVAYGIHVSIGMTYRILPGVFVQSEMRFRDPEVTVAYVYGRAKTEYQGSTVVFPSAPMHTRINVDGFNIGAGLMIDLHSLY